MEETFDPIPPPPAGPHPAPDEIYRARTDPAWSRSPAVLAHVAACAACTEEALRQEAFDEPEPIDGSQADAAWELFQGREAAPSARPAQGPVPVPDPPEHREDRAGPAAPIRRIGPDRRPLRTAFLLAATLAACAVGVSLWRLQVSSPALTSHPPAPSPSLSPDTTRGGPAGSMAAWSPSGELSEAPHEFLFPQEATGPRRVTVYDAARSYFWTSPPSRTGSIPFPESERSKLTPGVDYFWTLLGDEATPSEGAALRFRLVPDAGPG